MSLPADLKVALVHDWLNGMRGGEKVLEALIRLFPQAEIFTLFHERGKLSPLIEGRPIHTSFVERLPFVRRHYRWYLPLFPMAAESLDLSGFRLVISTSHCAAKGIITGPDSCHISYCFTPMRYAWDQYRSYFGRQRGVRALVTQALIGRLRLWDVTSAARVDRFLTISDYVARRIRKYYRRDSEVIPPPVDTDFFTPGPSPAPGDYYLAVSALTPYKRLDIVVEAAPLLPHPVRIAGTGGEADRLRKAARGNVEFLGWVSDEGLRDLYRGCRALLFPGEEDFGLIPVEAQACGRPVVAFGRGGLTETVVPHGAAGPPTGVFFHRQDSRSLIEAVLALEQTLGSFDPPAIRRHALDYSLARFNSRMTAAVERAFLGVTGA